MFPKNGVVFFFVTQLVTQGGVMYQKKMPFLYERQGIYYFRYRFSASVRNKIKRWEYCVSLQTRDFDKASLKCLILATRVRLFEKVIGDMALKELTRDKAEELINWYFRENYEKSKTLLGMDMEIPNVDLSSELVDEQDVKSALTIEIMSGKFSPVTKHDAQELLAENGLIMPEKGPVKLQLLEGVARARLENYRIYIETIKGNFHERAIKEPMFLSLETHHINEYMQPDGETSYNLSSLISTYLEKMKKAKKWTTKTSEEKHRCLVWIIEAVGDKDIKKVTKEDMRQLRDLIEAIPSNYAKSKQLKEKTILKAVKLNKGKNVIAPTTAHKYWGVVTAFMNWISQEGYIIGQPPTNGLKVIVQKNPMDGKHPLSKEQLRTWFKSPVYTGCKSPGRRMVSGDIVIKDGLFWIPLIGLYSGMRLGEIIQLQLDDFYQINEIWVFDVKPDPDDKNKSVKTISSVRKVPLHKYLLKFGFVEYWQHQKLKNKKRIFEDIKPSSKGYYSDPFSKKFSRGLKTLKIKTNKTSFHSLRHNVKDALNFKDVLGTHQDAILGHTQKGMNAVYGSKMIKKLKKCIDRIEYDLDFTHLL